MFYFNYTLSYMLSTFQVMTHICATSSRAVGSGSQHLDDGQIDFPISCLADSMVSPHSPRTTVMSFIQFQFLLNLAGACPSISSLFQRLFSDIVRFSLVLSSYFYCIKLIIFKYLSYVIWVFPSFHFKYYLSSATIYYLQYAHDDASRVSLGSLMVLGPVSASRGQLGA